VTYNFQNRYFAEFNGAYNGSENFVAGKRYGFFPAVSAGWTISNETFMENISWIGLLKIRGSYGKIGFDKIGGSRFLYLDEYAQTAALLPSNDGTAASQGSQSRSNFATQFGLPSSVITYPVAIHSRIGNPNVTWETSTKRNFGFESSFLNNMFSLTFDLFDERRKNILLARQSGLQTYGEAYASSNLGEVYNYGYEIELRHRKTFGKFSYGLAGILSLARNRIISLDEPIHRPEYQKAAGYQIGQFRGYQVEGFYMSKDDIAASIPNMLGTPIPGDLKFKDYNNDGVINTDDIAPIGFSDTPEYNYSVEPNFSWNGIGFSVLIQGVRNVSSNLQFDQRVNGANQMYAHMLGRWTPENAENATWPALQPASGGNFMSYATNDFLLTNANYLKIRNAQVFYQLPKKLIQRIGLSSFRVFVSGQNLYTKTKVLYIDPENNQRRVNAGHITTPGINAYPSSRIYNLGINIEF
jgi:TonB-linked SusC/RagA family outer membrane protein